MYTGFVYIWYDRKRKLFCLGSHMGAIDDGYTSSTGIFPRVYKKRPEDFKRRIIYYHNGDYRSLLQVEQKYLDMIKTDEYFGKANQRYYNMKPYASGISGEYQSELKRKFWNSDKGQERKKELSKWLSENNPSKKGQIPWNKGKECPQISESKRKNPVKYTQEYIEQKSKHTKELWEQGVYDNRPKLPPEHYEMLRQLNTGRPQTEFQKQKAKEANQKMFEIIYDTGEIDICKGLKQYCQENNLSLDTMNWCIKHQKPSKKNGILSVKVLT